MNKFLHFKSLCSLVVLLMAIGAARAQTHEFAPVGAEWYYERLYREGWFYSGVAYDRFRSLRTVEINGWDCKEIELFQDLNCDGLIAPYTEISYITQEGNQIYEVENGQRLLLYDFDKNPGESWFAPKYDVEVYVIDTSTLVLEDGSIRKVLQTITLDDYLYIDNIIEGIGMDRSVFPFYDWDGPPPCKHSQIRCYSENGLSLIVSDTECDYEILSVEENASKSPAVYPNPFKERLVVELPTEDNYTIMVCDTFGRTIIKQDIIGRKTGIDFPFPQSGVFHLVIQSDSYHYVTNVIKL